MKCDKCGSSIKEGEQLELHGQTLCEDCYMDALSPARACDPWAVHSAKSFAGHKTGSVDLTEIQQKILDILKSTGGVPLDDLAQRLMIRLSDLEREIATLRHMEKVRGALKDGKKIIGLWSMKGV
jgi:hypothetical protein